MPWITGFAIEEDIKTLRRKGFKVQRIGKKLEEEIRDIYFEGFEDEIAAEKPNVMVYIHKEFIEAVFDAKRAKVSKNTEENKVDLLSSLF